MKNKKIDLKETLNRFNNILKYDYIKEDVVKENFPIVYGEEEDDDEDLILGSELYEDDDIEDDIMSDLNLDDEGGEDVESDEISDDETPSDETSDEEISEPMDDLDVEEPIETDEVEIDITELVNSTEEIKQGSVETNSRIDKLLTMFSNLENKLGAMEKISNKIDSLEKEIEERNPTPKEKLEMRSLDSYPYSVKLTDFWKDEDEPIDKKEREYTLTQNDVDTSYSETEIKKTFN
jgi:hypothetical protein